MPNELIDEINRIIPNKNLQNLIFNYDGELSNFLTDDSYFIKYFSNSLIVATNLVVNAFFNWKRQFNQLNKADRDKIISRFSNSMIRIYTMLDRAYDPMKVDSDFVDNLINNLYIDSSLNTINSQSFLETVGLFNFFSFDTKLTKYIHMLKQKRLSTRRVVDFKFSDLCECFEMLPFLSKVVVLLKDVPAKKGLQGIEFVFKENFYSLKNININYSIFSYYGSYYYMEDFLMTDCRKFDKNGEKNQVIFLNFLSFDKADQFRIVLLDANLPQFAEEELLFVQPTVIEDFLIDYDVINIASNGESYFFKDYLFLNNKYIKYLSLTISDTISMNTKNEILNKYRSKYKNIFDKMYVTSLYSVGDEIIGYRWDEIIIFLLLEEGIFSFLQFLLTLEDYESFLSAFCLRFGGRIKALIEKDEFLKNPLCNLQYKNEKAMLSLQTKALILLATKLLATNDLNMSQSYNPTTIDDILFDLKETHDSKERGLMDKNAYYINVIIRTILFIDTFYKGIFEFARNKKLRDLQFEEGIEFNYQAYKSAKNDCFVELHSTLLTLKTANSRFSELMKFQGNACEYYEFAKTKVSEAFKQINAFNELCSKRNFAENEILFDTLGRRVLYVSKDMERLNHLISDKIELLKTADTNEHSDELYNSIVECLNFFKVGNMSENHNPSNVLYPVIGHYSNGITSRDGYKYSYFFVDYNENYENQTQIKMITDDDFDFGEAYFCVPNINRIAKIDKDENSFDHIWISPIIIPCNILAPQVKANFIKLSEESDFDAAVELLYNVDVSIWGSLFGDIATAKKVMPLLFNNQQSVFYKNYFYIMKVENTIVAIASLYGLSAAKKWDSDLLEMAFGECGLEVTEKTKQSYAYFKDTFNDYMGNDYTQICDLCVNQKYRNKGIAKTFLKYLIKKSEAAGKSTLITVYGDNTIACNLYFSMGFIRYAKDYDTRGTARGDYLYYKMIKSI